MTVGGREYPVMLEAGWGDDGGDYGCGMAGRKVFEGL